jgi:hypothetical protein
MSLLPNSAALLPLSAKLFAGKIIYIAVEAAATSDVVTKPITASPQWRELGGINSVVEKKERASEPYDEITPDGWRTGKDEYVTADVFEVKTRFTTALFEQLRYGLAAPITQGTPQTPFVRTDRKIRAWVNMQERLQDGQDRVVASLWCDLRAMDPPPSEKKTQEPMFEMWVLRSTLNSINFPT